MNILYCYIFVCSSWANRHFANKNNLIFAGYEIEYPPTTLPLFHLNIAFNGHLGSSDTNEGVWGTSVFVEKSNLVSY